MMPEQATQSVEAITALILEIFRLNGRLLAAGDKLVAGLALTSARWQVLGAIALAQAPEPVAHLARSMGLNRQGVQRIINELAEEGIVAFRDNPNHRRARLVVLTQKGSEVYAAASRLQQPWAQALAASIDVEDMREATLLLGRLRRRLEVDNGE
ncbi:MarR family winged helix-turn-helix transcriptional regulator [Labrys okinawensis]|uniref:MarR family winged helix-turn-helix transcriptional regulator n=1 Tax=Labrys okinawensis TaxID=346911 RepID=UPI0039BD43F1